MVALSDLNDDCLTAILSYLTFTQLFNCISSLHVQNKAFYRCALAALKRNYGPFSLEPKFDAALDILYLADPKDNQRRRLNVPQKFPESALADSIEQAAVPFVYNFVWHDADVWYNLVKALPCINSLSIHVIRKSNVASSSYVHSILDTLTLALSSLFPQLRSLAVVGSAILPGPGIAALMEVIGQMPVVSLKIPSYMLKAFLTRLPDKANELKELFLYRNLKDDGPETISCALVIDAVCDAGCAELTHLKYKCRPHDDRTLSYDWSHRRHDCVQAFAPLQKLPKLHTLTLDIDFGPLDNKMLPPKIDNRVDLVSLSELNVMLRENNSDDRVVWTHSLFRQFTNVRTAHISTVSSLSIDAHRSFVDMIGSALSHSVTTLRELTMKSFCSRKNSPPLVPPLLPNNLRDFNMLERIVITGYGIDLRYIGVEGRTEIDSGYPFILELIERLRSCRRLKSAKVRARISADEIKAVLPDCCEVVGVVESILAYRLRQGIFVLRPDNYWCPMEILISIEKEAVCAANETSKLALRIISAY